MSPAAQKASRGRIADIDSSSRSGPRSSAYEAISAVRSNLRCAQRRLYTKFYACGLGGATGSSLLHIKQALPWNSFRLTRPGHARARRHVGYAADDQPVAPPKREDETCSERQPAVRAPL